MLLELGEGMEYRVSWKKAFADNIKQSFSGRGLRKTKSNQFSAKIKGKPNTDIGGVQKTFKDWPLFL